MSDNPVRDIDLLKTWILQKSLNFTRYFFKVRFNRKFIVGNHHIQIGSVLDRVLNGELKKVIINIAPRYGKTEQAVKNFIAQGLAINPKAKFIHLSYSDDLVLDNSKEIQSILLEPEYQRLFDAKPTSTNAKKWYTKEGGGLYAVSSSGQVTGFGAGLVDLEEDKDIDEFICLESEDFGGAIIIDDPIKPDDALSPTIRNKVNNKFDTTIRNRVNSRKTPIIIIGQRVHENDLCGYLLANEPGEWFVLSIPCLYMENENEKALWEFKHTVSELKKLREVNYYVFDTQYQQDPKPLTGLMYEQGFKEYEVIPAGSKIRKAYTDTADEGSDYLCSIVYDEMDHGNYIIDVLYTQKPMEFTEPTTAEQFTKHGVLQALIESNNGGRGFSRAVEKKSRLVGENIIKIKWVHQREKKKDIKFTQSAAVQNLCYMPKGWDKMWPGFNKSLMGYMKVGKNDHDDAEDGLTGTVEQRKNKSIDIKSLMGRI
jgi:predicted phage terminase large subunit-like protein